MLAQSPLAEIAIFIMCQDPHHRPPIAQPTPAAVEFQRREVKPLKR
jgi:hypothetical protein